MNVYNLRHCREDEHVFWICETCLPGVRESMTEVANKRKNIEKPKEDLSDNAKNCLEFAVSHLQTEFAEIKKCVNDLKQSFSSPPAPVSGESTARLPTSTPKIHTSFTMPSNPTDRVKLSVGSSERYASPNEGRKFWIFFTKVAKHVSCEEISAMVTKHLNLSDPPDVVRLVPHWINDAELRYVSFKVGVCWRYKKLLFRNLPGPPD